MKSYQIKYSDTASLESELDKIKGRHPTLPDNKFIFYITWSVNPQPAVPDIARIIEYHFPDAIYYGNEVSASIIEGVHQYGLFICCQVLEEDSSRAGLLWIGQDAALSSLEELWAYCRPLENLKGIELIPSSWDNEMLQIDNSRIDLDYNVLIFGGLSVSCQELTLEASVFAKGHPISKKGTAVILYFGKDLHITSNCIVGWKGLGRYMPVTRSSGKIIHEIDGQKPADLYEKYLNIVDNDSTDTLVFPLMLEEDGIEYLRTPREFFPDKSVNMIVPINEGALVRIAYGDKNTILDTLYDRIDNIESFRPEVIKSFSCAARKWFWGDEDVSRETAPIQEITDTNGFYTGGEVFRVGNKLRILNSSLVLVSFRESEGKAVSHTTIKRKKDNSLLARITHFTGKIVQEQEEALKIANEEKHRNRIIHDIIRSNKWSFIVDKDGMVVSGGFAENFQKLVDIDLSSSVLAWTEIIHPDDKTEVLDKFNAVIRDHSCKTPFDTTYRMMENDGKYHWFRSAGRIMHGEFGFREFLGIHVDISDQVQKQIDDQKKIREALALSQAANKSKTTFLFNMSHDIRTPMNAIRGFTSMAIKNCDDKDKVTEYLNKIDLSGQQLLMLINQVLEMSRIESGSIELDYKPVNLRERYKALVTVLGEQARDKGLTFNHRLVDIKHFNLLADEARMSQITLNITGNAIKYTHTGGTIDFVLKEIECERRGYARYVFTVQDNGIGMSKEFQKVLFQPFTREKSSTVSKIQGTGLGLSIVKSLLELVGGTIQVESEPGKGTRFDITADFEIDNGSPAETVKVADCSNTALDGRRILLVEDNELNREIARFILEDMGIKVEEAEDGNVAVRIIDEQFAKGEYDRYDCILMDIQMPAMDGYEATRQIRKIDTAAGVHIPIVAMTANAFAEDRQNAMNAGMDGHLAKPIDVDKLKETLLRIIQ